MSTAYVTRDADGYRVTDTRVSLDSVVYAYASGQTAESIAQSFPSLSLEQVHGALAYYLANREEVDAYLERSDAEYETAREEARQADPMFYQKLAAARHGIRSA